MPTWTNISPVPSPIALNEISFGMDWDGSKIVLFGGRSGPRKDDTWEFQAGVWTHISPIAKPAAVSNHCVCWDGTRIVTFAGITAGSTFQTFGYTGATWTNLSPGTVPAARSHPMAAYTGDYVLMFGGQSISGGVLGADLDETWIWDGSNWTQIFPANSPPASATMMMASDREGETILFGGPGATDNKTYRWDPDTPDWVQLAPADNPPIRAYGVLAWRDTLSFVLFGGLVSGAYLDDTWEWNGVNWYQCAPDASPSARDLAGISHYPGGPVLFGGEGTGPTNNAETWQYTGSCAPAPEEIAAINHAFGLGV